MPRRRSWTDEQLVKAVVAAVSWNGAARLLGLKPGGDAQQSMLKHWLRLGLDVSHLPVSRRLLEGGNSGRAPRASDESFAAIVGRCRSWAQVLRELKVEQGGGSQQTVKARAALLGLDTSHFRGRGWRGGLKNPPGGTPRLTPEQVLILGKPGQRKVSSVVLRRALREVGVPYVCALCGQLPEWNGEPLVLPLDHVNGRTWDNRKENLRFLCPNCHSQTPTFGVKNKGAYSNGQRDHVQAVESEGSSSSVPTKHRR